jgi:hypothetical protein
MRLYYLKLFFPQAKLNFHCGFFGNKCSFQNWFWDLSSTSGLRIIFRIINDFVHRFILDRTFVDFTVSLLFLPFYVVDFNSKMVKSTVKP